MLWYKFTFKIILLELMIKIIVILMIIIVQTTLNRKNGKNQRTIVERLLNAKFFMSSTVHIYIKTHKLCMKLIVNVCWVCDFVLVCMSVCVHMCVCLCDYGWMCVWA